MSLSSNQLDAFSEIAKTGSFSKAAKNLALTQSALSQRIMNLEEELGTALLIRASTGIRTTAAGEELLRYCQSRANLETECLSLLKQTRPGALAGTIRIGGYSTVMRSLALPSLANLLARYPELRLEIVTKEMRDLPGLLRTGATDYIFVDHPLEKRELESHLLGYEEYVLIESRAAQGNRDVIFDHDAEDDTTFRFFETQEKPAKKPNRSFLDEIYGIIDGVALGLGRAVVPKHLIAVDKRVRTVSGLKTLLSPVYLACYQQSISTQLHQAVMKRLIDDSKKLLRQKN